MAVRSDGRPTRAEQKAQRRADADAIRDALRDRRPAPEQFRPITQEDVLEIVEAVADGDTARGKCRELGVNYRDLRHFLKANPTEAELYERAKTERPESWAEMMIEVVRAPISREAMVLGHASAEIQHRNSIVGVLRWLAGKYHIKFSDKQTTVLEGNPERPLVTAELEAMPLDQLLEALKQRNR